jgi:hypothetical protein
METHIPLTRSLAFFKSLTLIGTAIALAGMTGCSSSGAPPSKTATGAGTGAGVGAVAGGLGAAAMGSNPNAGILAGAAGGAIIGGLIGLSQEIKDRKEQDRLAQERAYQQDLAKKRAEEARNKAEMDEEIAVAQGFKISEMELNEAQKKLDDATSRLKSLQAERSQALARKKALDDAHEKLLSTEAEIARLEEELARLKGDGGRGTPARSAPAPAGGTATTPGAPAPTGRPGV